MQLKLDQSLGIHHFHVIAVHAHVAIVGVVLLTIVGVAHRLFPMFLLSHGADERPAWIALVLRSPVPCCSRCRREVCRWTRSAAPSPAEA
ncbi:MAG: hypothetical protein ABJE66_24330 [Deltaproteobacteria bacterium]